MASEQTKNVIVGVVAAVFIVGGAYIMFAGGAIGKEEGPQAVAQVEVSDTVYDDRGGDVPLTKAVEQNSLYEKKRNKSMNQDGVTIEIKKEGQGDTIKVGQTAVVHYTGMFPDGKVFDSSVPRGQPFPVQLGAGMVIQGWEKGLLGMKKGEQRRLTIPPELGYGAAGAGGVIPPNATLVFDVELLEIK